MSGQASVGEGAYIQPMVAALASSAHAFVNRRD
jgi:hypothetical protein